MESIIAALFVPFILVFFWVVKRGRSLRLREAALKPLIVDDQATHQIRRLFFSGLAQVTMLVGFLGAIGLLGWQSFMWLKLGEWPTVQLRHLTKGNTIVRSDWVGVQTIIEEILSAPLSVTIFLIGGLASVCFNKIGHQHQAGSRQ